ncbi:hypothetical protein [Bacillus wiedmannii]|uniref:hypothetical protein n=1 Tax=Bacillus wiedmannii TaxID=1890302 RepID=UPI000AAC46BB|nr:hypothetical protein [Bacillus wiedmannii]HDR7641345.1 hypothetical protein [Bacillus wiedmannii]
MTTKEKYVKLEHVQELIKLFNARDRFNDWSDAYAQYDKKIENTIEFLERNAKEIE